MKVNLIHIFYAALLSLSCISLCGCQGRTMENMEPTGDTVEVKIGSTQHRADTVLNSMDEQMLHSLDDQQIINTKL